jgi:hypothetical protein
MVFLLAVVGALFWNHHVHFFYSWADEQIHFYVARRLAQGAVLYRDIDSARPPLVLYPLTWLIRMGCSPLFAGRALVLGTQLITAGLLLWGGWRLTSWRAGMLAALLFLSSPDTFDRIHYTGIHLVALTVSACALFYVRKQPLWAGVFFGLTLVADQHGLVVCSIVALMTVVRRPRDAIPFAIGALAICLAIFGGMWVTGSRHLWKSLVGIHLFHMRVGQGSSPEFWGKFVSWLYEHGYLFMGAGLAAMLSRIKSRDVGSGDARRPTRAVRVILLLVGAHIAVVLAMTEAVFLYVVVIAPLLALLAGIGFDAAVASRRQQGQWSKDGARRGSRRMLAGVAVVVALIAGGWAASRSRRESVDKRPYSFWPYVLHWQVARLQQLDAMIREISESMPAKDGTVFGDPTIATALALHSGRRVSGELADLNPSWIEAGTVKSQDVVTRIEHDGVAAVVSPPWGLVQDPYFKSYLFTCYEKPRPFFPPQSGPGEGLPFILYFAHQPGTSPCSMPPM